MSSMPFGLACEECGAILRDWRDAVTLDERELRSRLHRAADASERTPEQMRGAYLSSLAELSADEMHTVVRAQYPRTADVGRECVEHESRTGHSVFRDGWRAMKMPHDELVTVMRTLFAISKR
jgi:hypothetical protein